MTLTPVGGDSDLAVLNQVRNEHMAELSHHAGRRAVARRALSSTSAPRAIRPASPRPSLTATLDAADTQSLVVSAVTTNNSGLDSEPDPPARAGLGPDAVPARPLLPLRLRPGRAPGGQAGRAARAHDRGDDFDAVADLCEMSRGRIRR